MVLYVPPVGQGTKGASHRNGPEAKAVVGNGSEGDLFQFPCSFSVSISFVVVCMLCFSLLWVGCFH